MHDYLIEPDEAAKQRDQAAEQTYKGGSKWAGMTYEQGVRAALDWVLGDDDDPPMDD